MKNKIFLFPGIFLVAFILFVAILNYRYPFLTPAVGNWSVGYQSTEKVLEEMQLKPTGLITYEFADSIIPEKINYIADPFFLKEKDTFYLFVELKGKGNADIALFTSTDGKKYDYREIVLDESFHISYPQVFKHEKNFYMLPETKGSNNVLLYRAENFPFNWKIEDTLIENIGLKDPSILLTKEINLLIAVDDDLKQYMFTADSLRDKWREVKNYKQRWGNETRPGGRFFEIDEEWYLPVQNHSRGYGTGISLYKLEMEEAELQLIPSKKMYLKPQSQIDWFNRGMHHLDVQKIDDTFYMVYDGDRNLNGQKEFQYKRTLKSNLIDFYNIFK